MRHAKSPSDGTCDPIEISTMIDVAVIVLAFRKRGTVFQHLSITFGWPGRRRDARRPVSLFGSSVGTGSSAYPIPGRADRYPGHVTHFGETAAGLVVKPDSPVLVINAVEIDFHAGNDQFGQDESTLAIIRLCFFRAHIPTIPLLCSVNMRSIVIPNS